MDYIYHRTKKATNCGILVLKQQLTEEKEERGVANKEKEKEIKKYNAEKTNKVYQTLIQVSMLESAFRHTTWTVC